MLRRLAEEAPFDAVPVTAGGPTIPEAPRTGSAGRRFVMPVGDSQSRCSARACDAGGDSLTDLGESSSETDRKAGWPGDA